MQRYRINYHLLVGLVAGSMVLALTSYFVWAWQIDRKAGLFRERSAEALASNKLSEAFDYQLKYVKLRPDEVDAHVELANIAYDVFESEAVSREQRSQAFQVIEETVRRSDDPDLRRKLANMIIGFRPQDALGHVEELLIDTPNDPELNALRVRAMFQTKNRNATKMAFAILGYDEESGEFDDDKATVTDQPDIYSRLAAELFKDAGERELARRVIDRMVEINPELASAYLRQSVFLRRSGEVDEAAAALDKAYELDPDDAAVLEQKGNVALQEQNYEEAQRYFQDAVEKHPDNIVFYRLLAGAAAGMGDFDKAVEVLDRGIERFDLKNSIILADFKIRIHFDQNDYDTVQGVVDRLERLNHPRLKPYIDLQKAHLIFANDNWAEAAKQLKRVRPLLIDWQNEQALAGNLLARCYEQLGKFDLAYQVFEQVVNDFPNYRPATVGMQRVGSKIGRPNASPSTNLDQRIREMASRPEKKQDWTEIDQMADELIEARGFPESRALLVRAQILMQQKKFAEARKLVTKAYQADKEDAGVRFTAVVLLSMDPDKGPTDALALLKKFEDQWGESLRSRTIRAQLHLSIGEENIADQLHALADGIDEWSTEDQAQMMSTLGYKFQQLGKFEEASDYWAKSAALTPNSLPIRMQQFEVALGQQDEESIREAQQAILDFVGSEDDPSYLLTEIKRRLVGFSRKTSSREELSETRQMLDRALAQRPQWHELHAIYGKVLVFLNEDIELALQRFDDALRFGTPDLAAVALQVKLLAARGRFAEAQEKMELLPVLLRKKSLGRFEAEILIKTGATDDAYASAEKLASQQPNSWQIQVWFADICRRAEMLPEAVRAMRRATELRPSEPDLWTKLVALYGELEDSDSIESALREAALAINAEYLTLLRAKQYELVGRWQAAEPIYRALFEDRLDELRINRQMAQFYLLPRRKSREKAAPYLNNILRAAHEGRAEADNPDVLWARREAAKVFAAMGGYQESLKAQRLLTQSAAGRELDIEDRRLLAAILANRSDPESKLKAIRTLTEIKRNSSLDKKDVLRLARLLRDTNDWDQCQKLLVDAIPRFRDDQDIRATYVGMLIDRGDYKPASTQLSKLRDLDSQSASYRQLSARLASEQGDQAKLRKLLESMTPKMTGALDPKLFGNIRAVAHMAMEYGDYEYAEELFRFHARRVPQSAFELTQFLALHGDAAEAIDLMKRQFLEKPDAVLRLTAEMLRQRRPELGDRFDADIDRMIAAALRDDPDSVNRQMVHADILEVQQRYDACIEIYDKVLKRDDVPDLIRAAVMNNLGFRLALNEERLEEANDLINAAMKTFGPVEDMLDTRALVRIARKQYDLAVDDMRLATSTSQDPVKFFHLAKAQILAGDDQGALKAWERAQRLGFDHEALPPQEQEDFQEIKQRIEGLPSRNARL